MRAQDRIGNDHRGQGETRTDDRRVDAQTEARRSVACDNGHETDPWVMASTRSLAFPAEPENSATIRPWRIASTRSATARTSSRSEDAISTALPRAARF